MSKEPVSKPFTKNLEKYFRDLGEQPASNIYDMVVLAVEKPMLEMVMSRTDSNQSQVADMLGINRNTLRKNCSNTVFLIFIFTFIMIKQALISVSDKTGVLEFARELAGMGVKILSTGGTAKLLADNGLPVTEVADYTGFLRCLMVVSKPLHPKVHGGIFARRDLPEHQASLEKYGIPTIDMVVVNLYPFQATVAKAECSLKTRLRNIDIGIQTMLRSSAKITKTWS